MQTITWAWLVRNVHDGTVAGLSGICLATPGYYPASPESPGSTISQTLAVLRRVLRRRVQSWSLSSVDVSRNKSRSGG